MRSLTSSRPNFVRCINPNSNKAPYSFKRPYVEQQLRCGGLVEALRFASFPQRSTGRETQRQTIETRSVVDHNLWSWASFILFHHPFLDSFLPLSMFSVLKCGYPTRVSYQTLFTRYKPLLPPALSCNVNERDFCEAVLMAFGLARVDYQLRHHQGLHRVAENGSSPLGHCTSLVVISFVSSPSPGVFPSHEAGGFGQNPGQPSHPVRMACLQSCWCTLKPFCAGNACCESGASFM